MTVRMLILDRNNSVVDEYVDSLFKTRVRPSRQPRIRCVRTRLPSGRAAALLAPGQLNAHHHQLLQWLVGQLKNMDMPINAQVMDRELTSQDFFLHLEQVQKALIIHFMDRDQGESVIECSSKDFKRTQCMEDDDLQAADIPEVVQWLETHGICPEIHFYNVKSEISEDQESEKAMELILNELISG